jgi:hypothetical protein
VAAYCLRNIVTFAGFRTLGRGRPYTWFVFPTAYAPLKSLVGGSEVSNEVVLGCLLAAYVARPICSVAGSTGDLRRGGSTVVLS